MAGEQQEGRGRFDFKHRDGRTLIARLAFDQGVREFRIRNQAATTGLSQAKALVKSHQMR